VTAASGFRRVRRCAAAVTQTRAPRRKRTGCWLNVADIDELRGRPAVLKGVEQPRRVDRTRCGSPHCRWGDADPDQRGQGSADHLLTLGWEELPKSVSVYARRRAADAETVARVLSRPTAAGCCRYRLQHGRWCVTPRCTRRFFRASSTFRAAGPGEPIEESLTTSASTSTNHAVASATCTTITPAAEALQAGARSMHNAVESTMVSNHPEPERHAIARIDFGRSEHRLAARRRRSRIGSGSPRATTAIPPVIRLRGRMDESVGGDGLSRRSTLLTHENIEHDWRSGVSSGDTRRPWNRSAS